jgi:hypothetical protein
LDPDPSTGSELKKYKATSSEAPNICSKVVNLKYFNVSIAKKLKITIVRYMIKFRTKLKPKYDFSLQISRVQLQMVLSLSLSFAKCQTPS